MTVWIVNTSWAFTCVDIFTIKPIVAAQDLKPFAELRSQFQPADIRKHGFFISAQREGLSEVLTLLSQRDGTYPVLLDKNLNIMIDHRLPNPYPAVNTPYLGTHRGLYEKMTDVLREPPQIVFAGQLRVIGGKTISLIDQAGTFYETPADYMVHTRNAFDRLVENNQIRLETASRHFKDLGLIDSATVLWNFQSRFQGYQEDARNDGHVKARDAANFERICRARPECWQKFEAIDPYLRYVVEAGGTQYILKNFSTFMSKDMMRAVDFIQIWNMILSEGLVETMSFKGMVEPRTERGQKFDQFIKDLPFFIGPL